MSLLVHLRPNVPYLMFLLIAAAATGYGVATAGPLGVMIAISGGGLLLVLGAPVVASTVCRVPVVAVGDDGVRFPLMGVRLGRPEIASVRRSADLRGRAPKPVLLIFPADPEAVLAQVRPWLRRQARADLARHGTPIVLAGASLDRSLDEIAAAVRRGVPAS